MKGSVDDDPTALPIVFVHKAPQLPEHLKVTVRHTRLFNPRSRIFVAADAAALEEAPFDPEQRVETVALEDLEPTAHHAAYLGCSRMDTSFWNGFWDLVVLRFYYLEELLRKEGLSEVLHLEGDSLPYTDFSELQPALSANYRGLAVPFDTDWKATASVLYVRRLEAIEAFNKYVTRFMEEGRGPDAAPEDAKQLTDQYLLAAFRRDEGPDAMDALPVIPDDYPGELVSRGGERPREPGLFANKFASFDRVFDAGCVGHYLGGIDPRLTGGKNTVGYVNETAICNLSVYKYWYGLDDEGRAVLYLRRPDGRSTRVVNLHVHTKDMTRHASWTLEARMRAAQGEDG